MKKFPILIITFLCFNMVFSQSAADSVEMDMQAYMKTIDSIEKSFNYQYGKVEILEDVATINVPDGYKLLGAEQSNFVLTEVWGNPPTDVLGLLFPENITPFSDSNFTYAIEMSYSDEGYIEDEDAEDLDYAELLESMQEDAVSVNPERMAAGYPSLELVGWASPPFYDKVNKKLHWAKELKFDGGEVNTLNYNIRILGRKGYLNMNAIGDIDILPMVQKDINPILASVEFNEGNRYSDFDPDLDAVAAVGIGGLIAGKVLAKVGFFALLAKFWKFIALGAVALFSLFRKKIFGGKEEEEVVVEESGEEKEEKEV